VAYRQGFQSGSEFAELMDPEPDPNFETDPDPRIQLGFYFEKIVIVKP